MGLRSKAFVPRDLDLRVWGPICRGFLTEKYKLGLQCAQIEDVTGTKEDGQGHQQHGRCNPAGGQGGIGQADGAGPPRGDPDLLHRRMAAMSQRSGKFRSHLVKLDRLIGKSGPDLW